MVNCDHLKSVFVVSLKVLVIYLLTTLCHLTCSQCQGHAQWRLQLRQHHYLFLHSLLLSVIFQPLSRCRCLPLPDHLHLKFAGRHLQVGVSNYQLPRMEKLSASHTFTRTVRRTIDNLAGIDNFNKTFLSCAYTGCFCKNCTKFAM